MNKLLNNLLGMYKQAKLNKKAESYKSKVAELLNDINDPSPIMDYISESEAEGICKAIGIPHEASWYKGDLFGYIDEVPDGMVDVLIEHISEEDAESLWRRIAYDMGMDVDAKKQTKMSKKAEEDLIAIGWGLYTYENNIKANAEDDGRATDREFWNKINNDIAKVESWFLKEGYKKFFTKVRDEGHGKDSELGGTAFVTEEQLKNFVDRAEGMNGSFTLTETSGALEFPIDYDETIFFELVIFVDEKILDDLNIESKRVSKNKKLSSKNTKLTKKAKEYGISDYLNHFNDVQQYVLTENKGDLGKAVEDLLGFASSEYDKKNFPREYVYKLVKKYIDDTVKFQAMINHPIKEEYIAKAKELLNNYKIENKIASKTNKLQKKAVLQESENGLGYVLPNGSVVYPGDEEYLQSELKGDKELLEKTKSEIERLEKGMEEIKKEYPEIDLSKYPDSILFKLDRELKLKEAIELSIETIEDILNAFKNKKMGKQATKKQAEEKAKPILVDAYYYKYLEDIDRYVREKIEDRQYAYIEYPKDEYERKITVDDIKDKLNFLAEHYFTLDRKTKKGDKIVITNHATGEELGEKEYTDEKLAKKQNKLSKSATIKHENGVYNVYSESGKCLGKGYKTKEEAEKRLKQVEYFKNKKAVTGYDYWGPKEMPDEDEGTFRIKYYGGPGHKEYLRKARNGKYHWKNEHNFDYIEDFPFETTDYELAKKLVEQYGGEIEKKESKQVNNKRTSLKQIVISKMAKIKK